MHLIIPDCHYLGGMMTKYLLMELKDAHLLVVDTFPLLGHSALELEIILLRPLQCSIGQACGTTLGEVLMTPFLPFCSIPMIFHNSCIWWHFSLWCLNLLFLGPASVFCI